VSKDHSTDPDQIDTGKPVTELTSLMIKPDSSFFRKIHNSIQRRTLAAQTIDFSLMAMFQTFMDYLIAALQALSGQTDKERK